MKRFVSIVSMLVLCSCVLLSSKPVMWVDAKNKEDQIIPLKREEVSPLKDRSQVQPIQSTVTKEIKKTRKSNGKNEKLSKPFIGDRDYSPIHSMATFSRVTDTRVPPHNGVVYLYIEFGDGRAYRCSGSLIDRNTVLTAAHCIYDTYRNERATAIQITPARNGSTYYYFSYWANQVAYTTNWVDATPPEPGVTYYSDIGYDFAVINIAPHEGWSDNFHFPLRDQISASEQVATLGYPRPVDYNYYMYKSVDGITSIDYEFDVIVHKARQVSGMSGGPVWNTKSGVGTTQIAVISGGDSPNSWACQLDPITLDLVRDWAALN